MNKEFELRANISEMLKRFTDDYASQLESILIDEITEDVMECSDYDNGIWTDGDIALAIGRTLCDRLIVEEGAYRELKISSPVLHDPSVYPPIQAY